MKAVEIETYRPQPTRIRASKVKATNPAPLWPSYLYRGTYTNLSGDPGMGKTLFGCDVVARATMGSPFPKHLESTGSPLNCMIFTSEDSEGTFALRLKAAGADLDKVEFVTSQPTFLEIGGFLEGVDLLFIETMDSHMPREISSTTQSTPVRQALQPLITAARRFNTAILGSRHWNKTEGQALYRSSGSIAYVAAARVALSLSHGNGGTTRYLTVDKCNLGPQLPPLEYAITPKPGDPEKTPIIDWKNYDKTAEPGLSPKLLPAVVYLRDILAPGPLSSNDVKTGASAAGIPQAILYEAATYLKINHQRSGFPGKTTWAL